MRSNARHALFYMFRFAWKNRKSFLLLLGAEQLFYYALALTGILMPRWILSELFVNRNLVNVEMCIRDRD